jgi:uncharacterized membrane protein
VARKKGAWPPPVAGSYLRLRHEVAVGQAIPGRLQGRVEEFPGAPAERVAEVARLRAIAALAQEACLTGNGTADAAIRAANVATRAARDLHAITKASGKSSDGANALADYLAERAAQQEAEDAVEALEADADAADADP